MSLIKNNISLLPLLGDVISRTIKEQVEIPSDTLEKMEVNVGPDFKGTMTYCSFLEYWKNRYNNRYTKNKGSGYTQPVKDAFEKHKTSKITLRIMNTVSSLENGGKETGDNGRCYGLFQFCREYWSDYGITSQTDAETADIATRQFVKHATILGERISNNLGLDVFSPENQWLLYLCWQQGLGGTLKIYNGCEDVESFKGDKVLDTTPDIIGPTTADDIMLGKAILKKGDQSDLVKFIQIMLLKDFQIDLGNGGEFGDGVDGTFLDATHDAVEKFQEEFGLAVDGVIGKCTLETIIKGKSPKCCKSGACKEDKCKTSSWCSKIKKEKEKIIKKKKKSDKNKGDKEETDKCALKYNVGTVSEIEPKAPCEDLQLERIPSSSNAWRSGQPTAEELVWIIETYDIKHIVRMNGDSESDKSARCGGCLTTKNEETIAEYFNVEWYGDTKHHSGGSFYSSHGKGKAGEGRNIAGGSVPKIIDLIKQGNVLVHCRNGADRTGQMIGGYLSDIGWGTPEQIWDYSIPFNHWGGKNGAVCKGTNWGYTKYMEVFLPLRDWCEGEEWRKSCPSCDPDYIERYENSW
tara:strand:+ start:7493 stop:9223 length:1731 start_codon:yes stop_codon:yes gene_type:complete